jgi:hypothetical protein
VPLCLCDDVTNSCMRVFADATILCMCVCRRYKFVHVCVSTLRVYACVCVDATSLCMCVCRRYEFVHVYV